MPRVFGLNKELGGGIGDVTAAPTDDLQALINAASPGDFLSLEKGIFLPTGNVLRTLEESCRAFGNTGTSSFNNATTRRGQLFVNGPQSVDLSSIDIGLATFGTIITDPDIILEIFDTSVNLPIGSPLGASEGVSLSQLTNTFPTDPNNRIRFDFLTPVPLNPLTTYAFSIKLSAADSGGAFVNYQIAAIPKIVSGIGEVVSTDSGVSWSSGGNEDIDNWNVNVLVPGFSIPKRLTLFGQGRDTILNGDLELILGAKHSDISKLKINGSVTVRDDESILRGWYAPNNSVDDRGLDNDIRMIGEN